MFYKRKNEKGFTLIEVILAIAILGIIAVAFLPVFTGGFKTIVDSGKKADILFQKQDAVEQGIADETNAGTDTITLVFPAEGTNPQKTFNVYGKIISNGDFKTFQSRRVQ